MMFMLKLGSAALLEPQPGFSTPLQILRGMGRQWSGSPCQTARCQPCLMWSNLHVDGPHPPPPSGPSGAICHVWPRGQETRLPTRTRSEAVKLSAPLEALSVLETGLRWPGKTYDIRDLWNLSQGTATAQNSSLGFMGEGLILPGHPHSTLDSFCPRCVGNRLHVANVGFNFCSSPPAGRRCHPTFPVPVVTQRSS